MCSRLGQYQIETPDLEMQIKTIYLAEVWRLHDLPNGFETDAIKLVSELSRLNQLKLIPSLVHS